VGTIRRLVVGGGPSSESPECGRGLGGTRWVVGGAGVRVVERAADAAASAVEDVV